MFLCIIPFFVNGAERGTPNKKTHMKRISFSVNLAQYHTVTALGAVHAYKCVLCQKNTIDHKRMITHLNHDHQDKEFLYKVKLND